MSPCNSLLDKIQGDQNDDDILKELSVLCRDRVSQMTKTYNDIEAVTRLLEEKERDLELAARIGQTLLSKNKEVSSRAESLEEQLTAATDRVNQLRHDLALKDELLRIFNEDLEHEPGATSLESRGLNPENVNFLEKKIRTLEDENLNLKLESAQLRSDTDSYEEKEKKLVVDCIGQIGDLNRQVETLADELHLKARENVQHKDEVTVYLSQVTDLQRKIRMLTTENMEMHERLTHSVDSQRRLTKEADLSGDGAFRPRGIKNDLCSLPTLGAMQDRYDELVELLEEAQEDVRLLRGRQKVKVKNVQPEVSAETIHSLASELEASLQLQTELKEQIEQKDQQIEQSQQLKTNTTNSINSDITNSVTGSSSSSSSTSTSSREKSWKIFETTRAAKRAAELKAFEREKSFPAVHMSVTESPSLLQRKDSDAASLASLTLMAPDDLSTYSEAASQTSSAELSTVQPYDLSFSSDGYNNDIDYLYSSNPELGRPGIPGSNDLESALKRLAIRRANVLNERDFLEEEKQRKKQLQMSYKTSGQSSPLNLSSSINTPSNISSTSTDSKTGYRRSDKLQIVKPMEGSITLKHWQQLASPHLSGIFESREGVQMKSEKPAKPKEEVDSLSDLEEDESQDIQTRKQHDSGMIYTFTDSTICHMGSCEKASPFFQTSHRSSPVSMINQSLALGEGPIRCSTPKRPHSGEFKGMIGQPSNDNSFGAERSGMPMTSLGLASVLKSNENVLLRTRPNVQKSASTPMPASNQVLEQLSLDNSPEHLLPVPLNSSSSAVSRSRNLPGSRSFEQMMQESDEKVNVKTAVAAEPKRRELLTPGMTGQGLIQQLKSKGYSLYGLWGSGSKKGGETSDSKASDVDMNYSSSRESTPEKTAIGKGFGVLGALSKCGRNKDL